MGQLSAPEPDTVSSGKDPAEHALSTSTLARLQGYSVQAYLISPRTSAGLALGGRDFT